MPPVLGWVGALPRIAAVSPNACCRRAASRPCEHLTTGDTVGVRAVRLGVGAGRAPTFCANSIRCCGVARVCETTSIVCAPDHLHLCSLSLSKNTYSEKKTLTLVCTTILRPTRAFVAFSDLRIFSTSSEILAFTLLSVLLNIRFTRPSCWSHTPHAKSLHAVERGCSGR